MKTQKVNLTSSNLSEEKLYELRKKLPEVFSEEKIDWDKLKTVLGENVDSSFEKFNFTWTGKVNAIKNVLIPSKATLKPDKKRSVDFDKSENLFIEGDNLEALKLLQKAYFEKIKMIYIDPPYNTGGDFVYKDNFTSPIKNYLEQTGQVDSEGNRLQTNKETSGRYHSDWLSMMYPRLKLAWNLLKEDGVIFISIDDNEVHHLRLILNEIFGEENFVAQFIWKSRQNKDNRNVTGVSVDHEYVLCYSKHNQYKAIKGSQRKTEQYNNPDNDPRGDWVSGNMVGMLPANLRPNCHYDLIDPNTKINYGKPKMGWRYDQNTMSRLIEENRIIFPPTPSGRPRRKVFLKELKDEFTNFSSIVGENIYTRHGTAEIEEIFGFRAMDFPKPSLLIEELIYQVSEADDIILDFFAGSGTTGHSVLSLNKNDNNKRKFILVQLPEKIDKKSEAYIKGYKTIADVCLDRISRVLNGFGKKPEKLKDGFKVFKLDNSNYVENQFEFDPEKDEKENEKLYKEYLAKSKQGSLFAKHNDIDVIYENIIKEGLNLNSKIEEKTIGKNKVNFVSDDSRELIICLDSKITPETVKELTGGAFKGKTFICIDNALTDSDKANLALNLELKTI